MTDTLVERLCDVCGKKRSEHSISAGIPICPGIFAPTYRSTLRAENAKLREALTMARVWIHSISDSPRACEWLAVIDKALSHSSEEADAET